MINLDAKNLLKQNRRILKNNQNSNKYQHLHIWFPNIFEFKGGIQVYSAFLLEALQNLYPHIEYDVFLKHDTRCLSSVSFIKNTRFHFAGKWHKNLRTFAFATQLLGHGLWQRPSLIISSHLNFTVVAYLLKRLFGIPYWAVAHGVDAWNITNPTLKTALSHADRILAVSSYTRDRLLNEQNLDPSKIKILPNTFDASRFHIASKPRYLLERYGLKPEQPVILTVARLDSVDAYKGYDKIIQALPKIRHQLRDVHYIIGGKGDDRYRIEQLITQLGLQECVTLAGFIPDSELCDYYNLCDVFAMPSKGEGFGIVYLEALACGKPVIGGSQDGAIDALCYGELGVLVNPDDVEAIAQSLIKILKGTYPAPILYQPEILRQKVIDTFGFEQFKQTLATLINSR
ncbi:MAG: glycosyltransferase [Pelatocladus maniniholoensis HA4357-MV3]|jgi:glycosyltransferase involved in cell wall biosynthesis|uniref:Glycosyltransferase n=1 Tax=Pelatocladus maniniholoensis HA4357-MV3 TaxID=1117104 RepID=A0A9E3H7M8_9NOST|nr:glycosyltransferase [Pelatocladus maniniholoensis HA4357-MV3]BAZ68258.1 putative glycosyltransferase [Fischerella sp. NIES-4106]